jgi:DNA-binding GntR family transcriptional regulator
MLELIGEGVVERYPRSGYRYVDYRSTNTESAVLMRYMIEQEAAVIAVQKGNREDEVRIVLANDALRKAAAAEDLPAFADADREFHAALVGASHDNMLIHFFDFLRSTLFRQKDLLLVFTEPHRNTQRTHEEILQAFLNRDGERMQMLLKHHLNYWGLRKRLEAFAALVPKDEELFDFVKPKR